MSAIVNGAYWVTVWILVTVSDGAYNRGTVVYSEPVRTLEDCQRMQSFVQSNQTYTKCVEVTVMRKAM